MEGVELKVGRSGAVLGVFFSVTGVLLTGGAAVPLTPAGVESGIVLPATVEPWPVGPADETGGAELSC